MITAEARNRAEGIATAAHDHYLILYQLTSRSGRELLVDPSMSVWAYPDRMTDRVAAHLIYVHMECGGDTPAVVARLIADTAPRRIVDLAFLCLANIAGPKPVALEGRFPSPITNALVK